MAERKAAHAEALRAAGGVVVTHVEEFGCYKGVREKNPPPGPHSTNFSRPTLHRGGSDAWPLLKRGHQRTALGPAVVFV